MTHLFYIFVQARCFIRSRLKTTREAVRTGEKSGVLVSLDANIRPLRWESEAICRKTILSFLSKVTY